MNMKECPFQVQINLMKNMTSTQASCSRSGHNTPQRRPSGQQTPNRSRHQSGLQTPVSSYLYDTSSRSSMGEEGQLKNRNAGLFFVNGKFPRNGEWNLHLIFLGEIPGHCNEIVFVHFAIDVIGEGSR